MNSNSVTNVNVNGNFLSDTFEDKDTNLQMYNSSTEQMFGQNDVHVVGMDISNTDHVAHNCSGIELKLDKEGRHLVEDVDIDSHVHDKLELLNKCCQDINCLKNQVEVAQNRYRSTCKHVSSILGELQTKMKEQIKKAQPYFELKFQLRQAQIASLKAKNLLHVANSHFMAATEMASLVQHGNSSVAGSKSNPDYCFHTPFSTPRAKNVASKQHNDEDLAWMDKINNAAARLSECELRRSECEQENERQLSMCIEIERKLKNIEKKFRSPVTLANSYFEMKTFWEIKLKEESKVVHKLEEKIKASKDLYAETMAALEKLSTEIHEKRCTDLEVNRFDLLGDLIL